MSDKCNWKVKDDSYNIWVGSCGYEFIFESENPYENGWSFCPACGKKLNLIDGDIDLPIEE